MAVMPITTTDQWRSRQHEVVTKRNRKGVSSQRVIAYGNASVIGAVDADAYGRPLLAELDTHELAPAGAASRVLARMIERGEIRRTVAGWSAIDLGRAADAILSSDDEWCAMLGSEVRSWSQVVATGDLGSTVLTALHRAGLSGQYRDATWDAFAAQRGACGRQTTSAKFIPRRRLTLRRRKSDPAATTRLVYMADRSRVHGHPMLPGAVWNVAELPAPSTDTERMFIGHRAHARIAPKTRGTRVHVKRAARTIGRVQMPSTPHALEILLDSLAPGERVEIGEHITVTRSPGGKLNATDKRPDHMLDDKPTVWRGIRTGLALAIKLT